MRENTTILITGVAGFIGANLAEHLLETEGDIKVIGIDNLNDYYDVNLKMNRLSKIEKLKNFTFYKGDIANYGFVSEVFAEHLPDIVVNLAAQAGVRYSITNPDAYIESNILGFYNILECCRHSYDNGAKGVGHLVYASSSSVYGLEKTVPYRTDEKADQPVSLYAATKRSNELMAHAYSKLYHIPCTGLRFFTVYGPAGRPDMAYFSFTNKMVKCEKIQLFNYGDMYRDFTYIDDIISGITSVIKRVPDRNENGVRYKIYNIGNHKPESLSYFVKTLEECLLETGIISSPVEKEFLPMQPGDVYQTFADISELEKDFGFRPKTSLKNGLKAFAEWYKGYYIQKQN